MSFEEYLGSRQRRINAFLFKILPSTELIPQHLHQAMHYAVLNGGKRIRPLLVYATGEALDADLHLLDRPAGAIELIHAYSLVHDDLPAMDNDDLRRGKPTCHKAFDEATAILVGDALQTLAFDILTEDQHEVTPDISLKMVSCLAKASGSLGMAGGQALDLQATGKRLDHQDLKTIHNLKTGALISACIQLGVLASGVKDTSLINALLSFANWIGLCFQIQDDILDAEGSSQLLGKPVGNDQAKQKATFITLTGIDESKKALTSFYMNALDALKPLGKNGQALLALAEFIVIRKH